MSVVYLAWRNPDKLWWPVGRLAQTGQEYEFRYTRGVQLAEKAGFRLIPNFPEREKVYVSANLFPLFANRLPPNGRPDSEKFFQWLDLVPGDVEPLHLLARSGGQRETDMFEVFAAPEPREGRYECSFFVHGIRHRGAEAEEEANRLSHGDRLILQEEPSNVEDSQAFQVLISESGTHLGYVPRYLSDDIHILRNAGDNQVSVRVQRVNQAPTPVQFRLLCRLDSPWPQYFKPFDRPEFESLSAH